MSLRVRIVKILGNDICGKSYKFHYNSSLKFEIKAKQFYAASQRVL